MLRMMKYKLVMKRFQLSASSHFRLLSAHQSQSHIPSNILLNVPIANYSTENKSQVKPSQTKSFLHSGRDLNLTGTFRTRNMTHSITNFSRKAVYIPQFSLSCTLLGSGNELLELVWFTALQSGEQDKNNNYFGASR